MHRPPLYAYIIHNPVIRKNHQSQVTANPHTLSSSPFDHAAAAVMVVVVAAAGAHSHNAPVLDTVAACTSSQSSTTHVAAAIPDLAAISTPPAVSAYPAALHLLAVGAACAHAGAESY